jgi:small subunit ribosomal protein S3
MGQKVNPHLIRLREMHGWDSRWFNEKNYKDIVLEDFELRKLLMNKLQNAGISKIEIERSINSIKVIPHVSKPGIVIGRGGSGLEDLKKFISAFFIKKYGKKAPRIEFDIQGIKEPNLDAHLVAKNISDQLLRRLPYKRILVTTADKVISSGAQGVRILLSGRIAGAEIGRREKIQVGTVPLSTIREKINYASFPSLTKKGYIGIKVWINSPKEGAK